jgi:hypothetical protein
VTNGLISVRERKKKKTTLPIINARATLREESSLTFRKDKKKRGGMSISIPPEEATSIDNLQSTKHSP